MQVVEDVRCAFPLKQLAQVKAVTLAGIEVFDHIIAGIARLPDEAVGTCAAQQDIVALVADQRIVTRTAVDVVATDAAAQLRAGGAAEDGPGDARAIGDIDGKRGNEPARQ
ncbi:hypothetical protein D3C78_1307150 [compost metagenome]